MYKLSCIGWIQLNEKTLFLYFIAGLLKCESEFLRFCDFPIQSHTVPQTLTLTELLRNPAARGILGNEVFISMSI